MIIDAAGERSEQGRLLSTSPGSTNAVLDTKALGRSPDRIFREQRITLREDCRQMALVCVKLKPVGLRHMIGSQFNANRQVAKLINYRDGCLEVRLMTGQLRFANEGPADFG